MKRISFIAVCFLLFFSFPSMALSADIGFKYTGGTVSFKSESVSLKGFLEYLSREANIQIFTTRNFEGENQALALDQVPLKDALDKVLRGFDYAVIYMEGTQGWGGLFTYENNAFFMPASDGENSLSLSGSRNRSIRQNTIASGGNSYQHGNSQHTTVIDEGRRLPINRRTLSAKNSVSGSSVRNNTITSIKASQSESAIYSGSSTDDQLSSVESVSYPDETPSHISASDIDTAILVTQSRINELESYIESGRADDEYNFWAAQKDPQYVYNPWDDLASQKAKLENLQAN